MTRSRSLDQGDQRLPIGYRDLLAPPAPDMQLLKPVQPLDPLVVDRLAGVLAAGFAMPWQTVAQRELPAIAAFGSLTANGVLGTLVLIAAIVSLSKTWSAVAWIGSRLILAQARHGTLPAALAAVDPKSGAPRCALLMLGALTAVGGLMGRSAILPIVKMVAVCLALSMVLCVIVLLRRRGSDSAVPVFTVPGGKPVIIAALIGTTAMVGVALAEPLLNGSGQIPIEWILLGIWGALGMLVWFAMKGYRKRV